MTELPIEGLIITIGCPGAGKSTWAENNLDPSTLRLERDRFRECIFGSRRAYHAAPMDSATRSEVVTESMLGAMQKWPHPRWAVTDTGLRLDSVLPFMQECLEQDDSNSILCVVFPRTWSYLAHVNETRPVEHRIPWDILTDMYDLFNDPKAWWRRPYRRIIEVPQPC